MTVLPEFVRSYLEARQSRPDLEARWSGVCQPPEIGQRVLVTLNGLGHGKVVGYFTAHGWLGVKVQLEDPPDWWLKQTFRRALAHGTAGVPARVFGAEITFQQEES